MSSFVCLYALISVSLYHHANINRSGAPIKMVTEMGKIVTPRPMGDVNKAACVS